MSFLCEISKEIITKRVVSEDAPKVGSCLGVAFMIFTKFVLYQCSYIIVNKAKIYLAVEHGVTSSAFGQSTRGMQIVPLPQPIHYQRALWILCLYFKSHYNLILYKLAPERSVSFFNNGATVLTFLIQILFIWYTNILWESLVEKVRGVRVKV